MRNKKMTIAPMQQIGLGLLLSFAMLIAPALAGIGELASADESSPSGVSVPISSAVSELFKKAGQRESEKQWNEADELYQQILSQFDSKVVSTSRDLQSGTYHYQGVRLAVHERIAKWPADALEIYTANHAKAVSTGNLNPSELFSRYFATNAGKEAGISLLDREIEQGDFYTAQSTGNLLLDDHPMLGSDRPMILYRTAMASHCAGDDLSAKAMCDQLLKLAPDATGSIGGKTVVLSTELAKAIQIPAKLPSGVSMATECYSSFGGTQELQPSSASAGKIDHLVNSIALEPADYTGLPLKQMSLFYQNLDEFEWANHLLTQIIPAEQGGDIFFQDGRALYAIDGKTGNPLPGWLATYPDAKAGRYHVPALGRVRNQQLTLTVTPQEVLAVMGQKDVGSINTSRANLPRPSAARLVCLDRATGAERWTKSPADFPQSVESLRSGEFSGTPVVFHSSTDTVGDSVLIALHSSKPNGFDECHIVSLSMANGDYQWSTYVGGAAGEPIAAGELRVDKPSQMTIFQSRVLVMTNRGSIASLDAENGQIIWLYAYQPVDKPANHHERYIRKYSEPYDRLERGPRAWTYNPLFISQGSTFALPADANSLFILNVNTGYGQQVSMGQFHNAAVCLGIHADSICLATDYDAFFADWKKLGGSAPVHAPTTMPAAPTIVWSETNFTGDQSNPISGRGFLHGNLVYLPTRERLYQLSLDTRRISYVYPTQGSFDPEGTGGNLFVTGQYIVFAQPKRVSLYSRGARSN